MPDAAVLPGELTGYLKPEDVSQLESAYRFSEAAHAGQFRQSGEPYISHPLAVANILAQWRLDSQALTAALLHDVMEDTARLQGGRPSCRRVLAYELSNLQEDRDGGPGATRKNRES